MTPMTSRSTQPMRSSLMRKPSTSGGDATQRLEATSRALGELELAWRTHPRTLDAAMLARPSWRTSFNVRWSTRGLAV
jgi:hypothetical protein